jgi:hypothetical protein
MSRYLLFMKSTESESYVTIDGQPASLSWNKAPFWGLRPDLYYCLTVAGLLIWCALSDERTDLSFTIAAGPQDSWPYFTVSDSRFPFSSPPTTRRVTVKVFDPASTRGEINSYNFKRTYIRSFVPRRDRKFEIRICKCN